MAKPNENPHNTNSKYPKYRTAIRVAKGSAQKVVNKGDRVEKHYGEDLENRFRVTSDDPATSKLLKEAGYGELVEKVNIYFPYDLVEENCPISFVKFNSAGIALQKCDGINIYEKHGTVRDSKNNVYNRPVSCNEPCQNSDKFPKCPEGCTRNGNLKFFIRELFDRKLRNVIAQMSLHSFTDLEEEGGLLSQMKDFFDRFKSLAGFESPSPFLSFYTNGYIPFELTRIKVTRRKPIVDKQQKIRTGATVMGSVWAVSLTPDPQWLETLEFLQKIAIAKESGYQINPAYEMQMIHRLSPTSYAGLLPGTEMLIPEPDYTEEARRERAKEILTLARSRNWSNRALQYFMNEELDIASLMGLPADADKLNAIKSAIVNADPQEFDRKAEEVANF